MNYSYAAGVPGPDILVKAVSVPEHASHVGDVACVPESDVLVETIGIAEHQAHSGYLASVPSCYS